MHHCIDYSHKTGGPTMYCTCICSNSYPFYAITQNSPVGGIFLGFDKCAPLHLLFSAQYLQLYSFSSQHEEENKTITRLVAWFSILIFSSNNYLAGFLCFQAGFCYIVFYLATLLKLCCSPIKISDCVCILVPVTKLYNQTLLV